MGAIKILICVIFIFAHYAHAGMRVVSATDPNIVGDWNAVPNFFTNNPREWNISGELVPHWRAVNMDDLTGKWVLVPRPQRWIWDQIAVPLQEKGCIGVVVSPHQYFRTVPGAETFYDYRATEYLWTLPHNTLSISDFQTINASLADENSNAYVIVDSYNTNTWIVVSQSSWLIAWQIILTAVGITTIVLGLYLLIVVSKSSTKGGISTIQLSLIFITFGAIWRTIYCAVNPFMLRRNWFTDVNDLFLTAHAPFAFAPVFLIALYQHELMKKTKIHKNMFLNKMKIPFFVAIGVLFAVEIAISAVRSQGTNQYIAYINIILYLLVALTFSIFFIVTSIRITLFIKRMSKKTARKISLMKTATLLAISTIAQVIFIVSLGFFLTPQFLDPQYHITIWFFLMFSLYAINLIHIATYLVNRDAITASKSSGSASASNLSDFPPTSATNTKLSVRVEGGDA